MQKLMALWSLFKQGQSVSDPKLWKERQINATVLGGVILALINLLATFGVVLPVTPDEANAVGAGIIAVVNVILTITTTDKVGLPQVEKTEDKFPSDLPNG